MEKMSHKLRKIRTKSFHLFARLRQFILISDEWKSNGMSKIYWRITFAIELWVAQGSLYFLNEPGFLLHFAQKLSHFCTVLLKTGIQFLYL